jgi:hypothetical protein
MDNKYQEIIHEISRYIKPQQENKFRKEYGMKQLSNQVIELNKMIYREELEDKMENYYITDKIDGKRAILYITNTKSYVVSDKLEEIEIKSEGINIIDSEEYEGKYYIFDVMVYNGKNIIKEDFEERMKYFDKILEIENNKENKENKILKTKKFIKLGKEYKRQIKEFKKEKKGYMIDGIILTPKDGKYDSMRVYKYKPKEHLTVDFLIRRCPERIIREINRENKENRKKMYILFCGINKRVYFKLRMRLIRFYGEIFRDIDERNLPQYFPIQFEPSSDKYGYIYWDENQNLDNKVGEFRYNTKEEIWELVRIREDRKIEVERGNYYGNNYKIAELIWMSSYNPLIIEEEEEDNYFKEHDNEMYKEQRSFNSYVKSELFERYKNKERIIDLASGKGQDLFRYSKINTRNIIFLEIDDDGLFEIINRKHSFSTDERYRNSMNIKIQKVDLLEDYRKNIEKIDKIYNRKGEVEVMICNLAFHYFCEKKETIENVVRLIDNYIKEGGIFMFTAFDGGKIRELMKENNNDWKVIKEDKIKYGIRKNKNVENKIEVILPFSKNEYYSEYLVEIEKIEEIFKRYDMILMEKKSYKEYIKRYDKKLNEDDEKYVSLYYYYIFRKYGR